MSNVDPQVVEDFGREWVHFDQSDLPDAERLRRFDEYFAVFPWDRLPEGAAGFDAGCGTGRWAVLVAPRVGHLHLIDPSAAIDVARRNLAGLSNCSFHRATVDEMPLADNSMDFGYSLGVLHHIPDTAAGIRACVRKLRPGAPFLVYLYYAFDNRPAWFRTLWRASDLLRRGVSRLPHFAKIAVAEGFAAGVYLPLARTARLVERTGANVDAFPLSFYRNMSFYTMRTDALDRFGTRLERRFTRAEIKTMMESAGLADIRFSDRAPYWCAVGIKRPFPR
jgi:ubiquinone/menaquinone biosynthesis C-methylase UbiE